MRSYTKCFGEKLQDRERGSYINFSSQAAFHHKNHPLLRNIIKKGNICSGQIDSLFRLYNIQRVVLLTNVEK